LAIVMEPAEAAVPDHIAEIEIGLGADEIVGRDGDHACASSTALEIARPPRAVERRRLRSVDAEIGEPAASRHRLYPASLFALRRSGAEMERGRRAARVLQLEQRAQRSLALRGLDLRTGFGVVDGDGPEQPAGHRQRHVEAIVAAAVEISAALVAQAE